MKNTILKYLTENSITATELEQLIHWLKKPENLKEFQAYIKENYHLNMVYDVIDDEAALQKVKRAIKNQEKPVRSFYLRYAAAAAVFIGVLATGYFFRGNIFNTTIETTPIIVNNQIETGTDKAKLTLASGEEITLIKGASFQSANATSNGEEIVYQETRNQKPETRNQITYNTLTIPRGGQFTMTLADGTQVWLNSETQIKYPVAFTKGETRQVELIYGEAYFDVSPSTAHKGASFKVVSPSLTSLRGTKQSVNNNQIIEVLGTEFNLKAYKDETTLYTTLVEGKVRVHYGDQSNTLLPGQQAVLHSTQQQMEIKQVNPHRETAWRHGEFMLAHKTLKEIMQVLSRWYDMEVRFTRPELGEVRFVGVLGKDQTIVEILNTIKSFGVINDYKINNKTVTLM
ncbi:FecR domain-containing protein [uncultured Polaribacter sp.]|uniref:FecR family protein n=1 Tax=uncultured Polaribacter sp. TaxID=174711 RepID=UPI00261AA855|nr:FecR domain-containing protein [uncultured Polaribacter sp.]